MEQTFWQQHGDEISAGITIAIAILLAFAVDRLVIGRATAAAKRLSEERGVSGVTPVARTRLRLVRRLVFVAIIVIGVALALSQFGQIKRLATGILASTAVLGIVVGFAARAALGNVVSGVLLAITQPVRIGDRITLEDSAGVVDDLTLSYTFVDTGDGRRLVVPNETLISSVVFNHTTARDPTMVTVSAWLPPEADLATARSALLSAGVEEVSLAELTAEGIRLEVADHREQGEDRWRAASELRERAQSALAGAGLFGQPA